MIVIRTFFQSDITVLISPPFHVFVCSFLLNQIKRCLQRNSGVAKEETNYRIAEHQQSQRQCTAAACREEDLTSQVLRQRTKVRLIISTMRVIERPPSRKMTLF